MLKIKDGIDLKELEKYGFEYCKDGEEDFECYGKTIGKNEVNLIIMYVEKDRRITYVVTTEYIKNCIEYSGKYFCDIDEKMEIDNTLYDLIKDGLIEKVKE